MRKPVIPSAEDLHTMILLWNLEPEHVSIEELRRWPDETKAAVFKYCNKAYMRASDNNVRVPEKPEALKILEGRAKMNPVVRNTGTVMDV